jgi:hypothetical protein
LRAVAVDLLHRARAADSPETLPTGTDQWSVHDAPRVIRALHASAVLFDAMRQYATLPPELAEAQMYAHMRSVKLGRQLAAALKAEPCLPLTWKPADAASLPAVGASPPPPSTSAQQPPPSSGTRSVTETDAAVSGAVGVPHGTGGGGEGAMAMAQGSTPTPPLPAGWEARIDSKSGRRFYVNLSTKTTSWVPPEASAATTANVEVGGAAAALQPLSAAEHSSSLVEQPSSASRAEPKQSPPTTASTTTTPPLPEGWEARVDLKSSRRFYVNLATKTTSWTPPEEGVPPDTRTAETEEQTAAPAEGRAASSSGDLISADCRTAPAAVAVAAAVEDPTVLPPAAGGRGAADEVTAAMATLQHHSVGAAISEADDDATQADLAEAVQAALPLQNELDEMWSRMTRRVWTPPPASQVSTPTIAPPPPGASREELKAYRAAIRRAAVENVRKLRAENTAMAVALKADAARKNACN